MNNIMKRRDGKHVCTSCIKRYIYPLCSIVGVLNKNDSLPLRCDEFEGERRGTIIFERKNK